MRAICIDVMGSLIDHASGEPLPLAAAMLETFAANAELHIISGYSLPAVRRLLARLGLPTAKSDTRVALHHAADIEARVECARSIGAEGGGRRLTVVDSNPANVLALAHGLGDGAEVVGYLGSGEYPTMAQTCMELDRRSVRLALSGHDVGTAVSLPLAIRVPAHTPITHLVGLVPGLTHPLAWSGGGEREVPLRLLPRLAEVQLAGLQPRLWQYVAWIGCTKCLVKMVARLAFGEARIDVGDAYYAGDHVTAYDNLAPDARALIAANLQRGYEWMEEGLALLGGNQAESQRARWHPKFQLDRMLDVAAAFGLRSRRWSAGQIGCRLRVLRREGGQPG